LQKLALFCVKNANIFANFFGENILKIITSVPGYAAVFPGGINIDLRKMNKVRIVNPNLLELGPGSTWGRVLRLVPPTKYTVIHGQCRDRFNKIFFCLFTFFNIHTTLIKSLNPEIAQ
jgi:hypothetical protein